MSDRTKAVYTIVEPRGTSGKPGAKHWIRVGTAFENRDGSLNVRLDALPTNGMLHIRAPLDPDDPKPITPPEDKP